MGYSIHRIPKKKKKNMAWIPNLHEEEVQNLERSSVDLASYAKKLMKLILRQELETKADKVCCTDSDGRDFLCDIRCKSPYQYSIHPFMT